jgi:hypothetical protein
MGQVKVKRLCQQKKFLTQGMGHRAWGMEIIKTWTVSFFCCLLSAAG